MICNPNTYLVAGECEVGLETHLTGFRDRRVDLSAGRAAVQAEGQANTLEQDLEEDLGVEGEGRRVEGDGLVSGDERVGAGDRVGRKQVNELSGREASVGHAGQDEGHVALRERDGTIGGSDSCVRAASEELELRGSWAVRAR